MFVVSFLFGEVSLCRGVFYDSLTKVFGVSFSY